MLKLKVKKQLSYFDQRKYKFLMKKMEISKKIIMKEKNNSSATLLNKNILIFLTANMLRKLNICNF